MKSSQKGAKVNKKEKGENVANDLLSGILACVGYNSPNHLRGAPDSRSVPAAND
jgi:hypothetical protein